MTTNDLPNKDMASKDMASSGRLLDEAAVHALTLSTDPYLSCDECFDLVDKLADTLLADPSTEAMQPLRIHLRGCPACAEEAESLVALLAEDAGIDAGPVLARLRD